MRNEICYNIIMLKGLQITILIHFPFVYTKYII